MDDLVKQARDHAAGMGWRSDMENAPITKPVQLWGPCCAHAAVAEWVEHRKAWLCLVEDGAWAISSQGETWTDYAEFSVPTHWKPIDTPDTPDPTAALLVSLADEVVRLREAREVAAVDLDLLHRAIKEGDPKAELLIRVEDIKRRALAGEQGDG